LTPRALADAIDNTVLLDASGTVGGRATFALKFIRRQGRSRNHQMMKLDPPRP